MASLLVAGSIYLHEKIKDKKEAKREKKRQSYENRYNELQREHSQHEEKYLQRTKSGGSVAPPTYEDVAKNEERHTDRGSLKDAEEDGPLQWVSEAAKTRQMSR